MPKPSNFTKHQLIADAKDFFNRQLKYVIYIFITIYVALFLFNKYIYNWFVHNTINKTAFVNDNGKSAHVAADSGLVMNFKNFRTYDFRIYHNIHAFFAIGIFMIVLFQKFTVSKMAKYIDGTFYNAFLEYHVYCGKFCLFCVLIMDFCGLFLGRYSTWENFQTFNLFFFAPWIFMVIGIYGYAKQKTIHLHRYFGNMLLKGCIATPLARIAGSILQGQGFENSNGYYVGIGSVTIIISIWQIIDTYYLFQNYVTFRMQFPYLELSSQAFVKKKNTGKQE